MSKAFGGFVGLILFVGLAAGVLWSLEPEFQRTYVNGEAMAVKQMATQVIAASSVYRTEVGLPLVARHPVRQLKTDGYLRKLPINPYIDRGGFPLRILYSGDLLSSQFYADIVMLNIGPSEDAREVCGSINRQTRATSTIQEVPLWGGSNISFMTQVNGGCFRMHDVGVPGEANPHDYIVFARL